MTQLTKFYIALMLVVIGAMSIVPAPASAQTSRKTVFIAESADGFHTYIAAAIIKKKVPVSIVKVADDADYRLTASDVTTEQITTGRKIVNCLFAYCGGNEDKSSTSVEMLDQSGTVVWSYAVNKGRGKKNLQSMAEAIAKHMKDDVFDKPR